MGGRTWSAWRAEARGDWLAHSRAYHVEIDGLPAPEIAVGDRSLVERPWIVSGHQPVLAHPGVWLKNALACRVAERLDGVAAHLIVDNDLCATTSLPVPSGSRDAPLVREIAWDRPALPRPWEEVTVRDFSLFDSFGERVDALMASWGIAAIATSYWSDVRKIFASGRRVVDAFAGARRRLETQWRTSQRELPLSRMCDHIRPFSAFVGHHVLRAGEFASLHNRVLEEYRQANRIRSRSHPVAPLAVSSDTCELPFWIWARGATRRERLHVRKTGPRLALGFPGRDVVEVSADFDALRTLPQQLDTMGYRIRPRALTTTLFVRLFLADLFVHGIGGAKYDEMTDQLITRFYGLPAPAFLTATGTLYLPIASPDVGVADRRRCERRVRDLVWNADREPENIASREAAAAIAEKERLLRQLAATSHPSPIATDEPSPSAAARRAARRRLYHRLCVVKRELADRLSPQQRLATEELARTVAALTARRLLHNRDFATILHPHDTATAFFQSIRNNDT